MTISSIAGFPLQKTTLLQPSSVRFGNKPQPQLSYLHESLVELLLDGRGRNQAAVAKKSDAIFQAVNTTLIPSLTVAFNNCNQFLNASRENEALFSIEATRRALTDDLIALRAGVDQAKLEGESVSPVMEDNVRRCKELVDSFAQIKETWKLLEAQYKRAHQGVLDFKMQLDAQKVKPQ